MICHSEVNSDYRARQTARFVHLPEQTEPAEIASRLFGLFHMFVREQDVFHVVEIQRATAAHVREAVALPAAEPWTRRRVAGSRRARQRAVAVHGRTFPR